MREVEGVGGGIIVNNGISFMCCVQSSYSKSSVLVE